MVRRALIAGFAVCAFLAVPRPASAGFWAWLQELSGPGPFKGVPVLSTSCLPFTLKPAKFTPGFKILDKAPGGDTHCFYIEKGSFHADADTARGFDALDVTSWDFGGALRFKGGFDIGSGFGWLTFKNPTKQTERSRMTITPIRVVIRPLLLAIPEAHHQRWMQVLNVYWKDIYISPLDGTYFGLDQSAFHSNGEMLQSFGIILDFTPFIR